MNLGAADVSPLLAWRTASPPKPIPARDRIKRPVLQLVWKQVEFHMAVAKEHVEAASALVVVPDAPFVDVASIRVPGPVTLDDLVRWSERDLRSLDRSGFVRTAWRVGIACHMPPIQQTIADVNVRSHTFEFITPSMTDDYKIPNPCTSCHNDQTTAWARESMRGWTNVSRWRIG